MIQPSDEDKEKLRRLILEQKDLEFDYTKIPKFAVRKSWSTIEGILTNAESFKSLLFSIEPKAAEIEKSNKKLFDAWLYRQMKKLYDEIYEYAWGDYK